MPHFVQKLGPSNARFLVLSATSVCGEDAIDLNLAQEIVENSKEAHAKIAETCDFITKCGPKSVGHCKQLCNGVAGRPVGEGVSFFTARMLAIVTAGEEAAQAMVCLQKRELKPWEQPDTV